MNVAPVKRSRLLLAALVPLIALPPALVLLLPSSPPPTPAAPITAPTAARPPEFDPPLPATVRFTRDIRPILSDACFKCHGPASATRKADLRLDQADGIGSVVTAGKPDDSELFRRIAAADDHKDHMPPAATGKHLTKRHVGLLKRWIEQGAEWEPHWAFLPPQKPALPAVRDAAWPRNEIDYFVLKPLEDEGLRPSPEADRATLARRVALDLTGLPPSPQEIDAFMADTTPQAYESLVDRLLASPRYGEHMARFWLDQVRYADTHGLHLDNYREMWPYRDWVINAFNAGMPFDRFITEQLAGDLLPDPTLDQLIATGFNRCHITTNEGGSIDEEVYVRNVVERVDGVGQVLLGLSFGCARCHDHKYDPLTQKDYYQMFAFFNSLDGPAMDGNVKDHAPVVRVPTAEDVRKTAELGAQIAGVEAQLTGPDPTVDAAQAEWERAELAALHSAWIALEPASAASRDGATLTIQPDRSILAGGTSPEKDLVEVVLRLTQTGVRAIRLDALTDPSLPQGGPGRAANGNFVLSELEAAIAPAADPSRAAPVKFVSALADFSQTGYPTAGAIDGNPATGWAIDGGDRRESRSALFVPEQPFGFDGGTELKLRLLFNAGSSNVAGRLRVSVTTDAAALEAARPASLGPWATVGPFPAENPDQGYTRDFGPEKKVDLAQKFLKDALAWVEHAEYADGKVHALPGDVSATYLTRTITAPTPRTIHLSLGSDDFIKVWHDGALVLERKEGRGAAPDQEKLSLALPAGESRLLLKIVNSGGPAGFYFADKGQGFERLAPALTELLRVPRDQRNEAQTLELRAAYRRLHWDQYKPLTEKLGSLRTVLQQTEARAPTTQIYKETAQPREAFILKRGEYDQKGDPVGRDTPAVLPPMAPDLPRDRLGLARWLADPKHPLTARVAVNRLWQQLFGTGIVKTAEDFGAQGQLPSHPELLDFLAVRFAEDGWDVRRMMKAIVTSATYRQSARATPELLRRDPENRLLARGPRFRLEAETLRDQALAVSGLLFEKIGGPSVKPPQPDLWIAVGFVGSNTQKFEADKGPDKIHRRSLYTFWKRTSPPPQMSAFDAPSRESCAVRRERTNTPMQALMLMNDPQYLEAARALAARTLREAGPTPEERAALLFRLAAARTADAPELEILLRTYRGHRAAYEADPKAARDLVGAGEPKSDADPDPVEWAAWTLMANLVLNLDEVVTKG
jgi:hypothetical protein